MDTEEKKRLNRMSVIRLTFATLLIVLGTVAAASAVLNLPSPDVLRDGSRLPEFVAITIAATYAITMSVLFSNRAGRELVLRSVIRFNRALATAISTLVGVDTDTSPRRISQAEDILERAKAVFENRPPVDIPRELQDEILALVSQGVKESIRPHVDLAIQKLLKSESHEFAKSRAFDTLSETAAQLRRASSTVTIRGFINLLIGIGFAVAALYFLKESVELFKPQDLSRLTTSEVLYLVGIRISLSLIITIIAYFFLSLYRRSLEDVKYYQNEVTFISGKMAALSLVLSTGKSESIDAALPFLMDTDRNKQEVRVSDDLKLWEKLLEKALDKVPTPKIG